MCIGEVTADMLKRFVGGNYIIAKTSSADGIVDLIKEIEYEKIQTASLR